MNLVQWSPLFLANQHNLIQISGVATFNILIYNSCDLYKMPSGLSLEGQLAQKPACSKSLLAQKASRL